MINHCRNLLMNVNGDIYHSNIIAEEIIDPNYLAKTLPTYLKTLRFVLFGENPDRSFLNYRCRQLLSMIHASELVQFVTDLDPRITYDFDSNVMLSGDGLEDLIVTQNAGTATDLVVSGDPIVPDRSGKMLYQWSVGYTPTTTSIALLYPYQLDTHTPSFTSGLSQLMSLPGSDLFVRHYNVTTSWNITYNAKPIRDLGELLANIDHLGEPLIIKLFNLGNAKGKTEPYKTFYGLWKNHFALPYRLGAVVLAMAYQTNEL